MRHLQHPERNRLLWYQWSRDPCNNATQGRHHSHRAKAHHNRKRTRQVRTKVVKSGGL